MENEENALVKKEDSQQEVVPVEEKPQEENEEKPEEENTEEKVEEKPKKAKKPIDTSKGGLVWSIWNFLEAALIVALGIICFIYTAQASDSANYASVISVILFIAGIFLIAGGALKIIINFLPVVGKNIADAAYKAQVKAQLSYDLVIGGAIELAIGVAIVATYQAYDGELTQIVETLITFLAVFVGVIIIAAGVSLVLFAIGFIISKLYKIYLPIIEIVFGAALIALGIVVLYFLVGDKNLAQLIVLIIIGVMLVLAGLAMAVLTVVEINKARAKKALANGVKQEEGQEVVEGENK